LSNEHDPFPIERGAARRNGDVGLVDCFAMFWRRRRLVLSLCGLAVAGTAIVTWFLPKQYEARASILLPRETGGSGPLGSVAASALIQQVPGLAIPTLTPNRDMMLGILKSRSMADTIVQRFGLQRRYRVRFYEDAIRELQKLSDISITRDGTIVVFVSDGDPKIAADLANTYLDQLDQLVVHFGTGDAGRQRGFLAEQLARAKVSLDGAEDELRRFQEKNRAVALQEQTKGAIETAARLKGEIMATQVQLQVMRSFATEANPELLALRRRLDEMNRQFAQMQYGDEPQRETTQGKRRGEYGIPIVRVAEVGVELARLTREVKVQETLVVLLTQQFEQYRLAEARSLPSVQVLDRAVPPERPSRPRLVINVVLALATSLVIGVCAAIVLEYPRKSA
jgi:tyrosine-protein kinase Etk/Wzc